MLSFELPKAASRFGGVSDKCLEIAGKVIDRFVSLCSPREMLPILCEVCCYGIDWNRVLNNSL